MNHFFIIIFIVFIGGLIALQGTVNSALGKHLENPIHAALISFETAIAITLKICFKMSTLPSPSISDKRTP